MTNEITNTQDIIDSRDVIARIEELEAIETDDRTEEETEELATLTDLAEEASNYAPDWSYGEALIRDSYFENHTQEMLEDCGEIPRDLPGYIVIDWEATARNIQVDYTSVDFNGVTYWIR